MPELGEKFARGALAAAEEQEHRCACGRLIARFTARGIEIKCPRCKRIVEVSWESTPNADEP